MKNWDPFVSQNLLASAVFRRPQSLLTLAGVGHAEKTLAGVLELEVLVGELLAVDRLAASAVT